MSEVVEEKLEEAADAAADLAEEVEAAAGDAVADAAETLAEVDDSTEEIAEEVAADPVAAAAAALGGTGAPEPVEDELPSPEDAAAVLAGTPDPEPEPVASEDSATDADEPDSDEEAGDDEEAVAEVELPPSPYDLPGSWYVIHSYSGYENKVKANLETRVKSMHVEGAIFDVTIPMEEVVEIKSGRKVTVDKKQFPGYLLVRMYLDEESWGVVRNTPGVTGFVGNASKPTPLSRREVERILGVRKDDEEKKTPRFKPDWEIGETVRVIDGPFADFNGVIEDINVDQSKVRVLVDIFGRETPVELNFEQIQKF